MQCVLESNLRLLGKLEAQRLPFGRRGCPTIGYPVVEILQHLTVESPNTCPFNASPKAGTRVMWNGNMNLHGEPRVVPRISRSCLEDKMLKLGIS